MRVPAVADVVPSDQATKDGRVVLAGRSLRESEARTDSLTQLTFVAWIVGLLGALVTAVLVEAVAKR